MPKKPEKIPEEFKTYEEAAEFCSSLQLSSAYIGTFYYYSTFGECHFFTNLSVNIPPGSYDCRSYVFSANIPFGESFLIDGFHIPLRSVSKNTISCG